MKCPKCEQDKDSSEFSKNRSKKSGYSSLCKLCQKPYKRRHFENNRADYAKRAKAEKARKQKLIEDYKVSIGCRCGESHPATLDLHHIDPAKKIDSLSKMAANCASDASLMAEIAKCEVICSNCHRKLHWKP